MDITSGQHTVYEAQVRWAEGEGPIVHPEPGGGPALAIMLTLVTVEVSTRGSGHSFYDIKGVSMKENGTPSRRRWQRGGSSGRFLPQDVVDALAEGIKRERRV